MAEVYYDFSQALMESERPSDLEPAQMQDYEMALEETAFPFEDKAILVHEKNLELMTTGIYNPWIEKSFAKLADLMPGRYAKFEESSGLIASIDRYAYRIPNPRAAEPSEADVEEPSEVGDPGVEPDLGSEIESAQDDQAQGSAAAG
jgi:hypothetical protein